MTRRSTIHWPPATPQLIPERFRRCANPVLHAASVTPLPIGKWFNTSGDAYREMGLKDKMKQLSDEEKIALLASNGMLIKRPVVSDGKKVTLGHKAPDFGAAWGPR